MFQDYTIPHSRCYFRKVLCHELFEALPSTQKSPESIFPIKDDRSVERTHLKVFSLWYHLMGPRTESIMSVPTRKMDVERKKKKSLLL